MRFLLSIAFVLAALGVSTPSALRAQPKLPNLPPDLLAPTDAVSPEAERKQFVVPQGFEVQLVASEPDIQKPIQLAFDAKGRLWVTTSYHYPFAAKGKATDKLFVLSDFDPQTGKARKVQKFAEDLNIPIGILPLPDCTSCIVSSAGEIRKYTDTDGDMKADKMEVLFKGFGTRDMHGMYNSYTLMPDGWVYACHGFSNDSTVKGKDGHEVHMNSGNTFRFKPDGSRIEVWTRGQVNPFGIAIDPYWNLYTADCHSKPITQLIPGAVYQSFGKPHDGLGYAPHVTNHDHGSTALCGLTWYDAAQFPEVYRGCMFLGNVVTNRINFDRIEWQGATPVAKEQPDYLRRKHPWFRPPDIKLGPDGCLYVSDFYNKIIGHYEVDLKDPRRDHDHGRIWRIVWKGKDGKAAPPKFHRADFTKATDHELMDDLFHPNLTVRFLAGNQLRRRMIEGESPSEDTILQKLVSNPDRAAGVVGWILCIKEAGKTPGSLEAYKNIVKYAKDSQNKIKPEQLTGQLVRALASRPNWDEAERKLLLDIFKSFDSIHQKRACIEAVIQHPHADFVKPVIETLNGGVAADTHLRQAARIALRNCLRDMQEWPKGKDAVFVEMAVAIPNGRAAHYLASRMAAKTLPANATTPAAEHVARYGAADDEESLFAWVASQRNTDALLAAFRGVQTRGARLSEPRTKSLLALGRDSLGSNDMQTVLWGVRLLNALPIVASPGAVKLDRASIQTLERFATGAKVPNDIRAGAVESLFLHAPAAGLMAVRKLLADPTTPESVRVELLVATASSRQRDAIAVARDSLQTVPYRIAVTVGLAMAGTAGGADQLLEAVKAGKAPARLLQEKAILERLRGSKARDWQKRVSDLTKRLPPADQRIAAVIKSRQDGFAMATPSKAEGAKLFTKHCAACHKIGDVGGKIAPQLDGVGVRGTERLLEDILDPNRNVDAAFRAHSLTLASEKTLTALVLRTEGQVVVVADLEGKEQRIPLKEIVSNRATLLSAMPANFADVIPEADLYHIIAYLLDQKQKEPPKK